MEIGKKVSRKKTQKKKKATEDTARQAATKKCGACLEITNHKLQITNKSQSQNYKLQTKEVPYGQVLNACGEENTTGLQFFVSPFPSCLILWTAFDGLKNGRRLNKKASTIELRASMSEQKAPMPEQKASMPEQKAPMPELKALTPELKALTTELKASMPEQKAPMPEQKALSSELKALILSTMEPIVFDVPCIGGEDGGGRGE